MTLKQLKAQRRRLLRSLEGHRGADGAFATDEARTAFDRDLRAVEELDAQILAATRTAAATEPPAELPAPEEDEDEVVTERDAGQAAERERVTGILAAVRHGRVAQSVGDRYVREGTSLVEAQGQVLRMVSERSLDTLPRQGGRSSVVVTGDDPLDGQRAGITAAILHRVAPQYFPATDQGRQFRGLTLLDTARTFLEARGVHTAGFSKMELAGVALGLSSRGGGLHTTSDYAELLADVTNKVLRKAYEAAPQTFQPISRATTLPDFKPARRLQLGEAPPLHPVLDDGEFTRGTIGEGKETYQLATYGRVFGITRKAIVNDDTDAFSRLPMMFGRAARNLESNLVWDQILSNPLMGDGSALFNSPTHGNLVNPGTAIDIASVGAARASMRKKTGLDGAEPLNLLPKFLIVCPEIETIADQFVAVNLVPAQFSNANPFAGKLAVICEPRLSTGITIGSVVTPGDVNAWYIAADPAQIDIIEYAYLEGEDGPMIESRVGFDVDGIEIKCRHDFAAKALDWRGLFKNLGA